MSVNFLSCHAVTHRERKEHPTRTRLWVPIWHLFPVRDFGFKCNISGNLVVDLFLCSELGIAPFTYGGMILISQKSEGSGAVVEWGGGEESLISTPDTSAAVINHLDILIFIGAKVWYRT